MVSRVLLFSEMSARERDRARQLFAQDDGLHGYGYELNASGQVFYRHPLKPLFDCGRVEVSMRAASALEGQTSVRELIVRHATGDWSESGLLDQVENTFAVQQGLRVVSTFTVGARKVSVVTEADRSLTRIALADEG